MTQLFRFQRYSQRENVVTNNVLMLLSRLYKYRASKFERALISMLADQATTKPIEIGPRFTQQERGPSRIADGLIKQAGFDLLIETKLESAFDVDQAIGHLEQLKDSPRAILMLLGRAPRSDDPALLPLKEAAAGSPNVQIVVCSFASLIAACRDVTSDHEDELREMIDDFEGFCMDAGVLPIEEQTLFVPPCGESLAENVELALYYCPATRPRRTGAWFGPYKDKCVQAVGRIIRVVTVSSDTPDQVDTADATPEQRTRILRAIEKARTRGWDLLEEPHTFYVCDEMVPTSFVKTTPGGIPGHRYFDLSPIKKSPNERLTASSIAERLNGKRWEELR
jgi:hypothetical protein